MTFESLLPALGFERNAAQSRYDPRESFWGQIDGPASASICYYDPHTIASPLLQVTLHEDARTIRFIGSWDSPERAAEEVPMALIEAYRHALIKAYQQLQGEQQHVRCN